MKILIAKDASGIYHRACYRHARPDCGMLHNPTFKKMLEAIEGQWLDVETEHLFDDQFNTGPIPGVSEYGMRIMLNCVADIQDDVRVGVVKCGWCYGYDHDHDGKCDKCGKSEYLKPMKPLVPWKEKKA
jgi:hypothetical protein